MSVIDIGGIKINYLSLQGLGRAVEAELANTDRRLAETLKELKRLRRARRALQQMLGGQKARPVQPAPAAGAAREPACASR
ncbi:MAG: hypothetical protein HY926_01535 [Elusimicrobia bacterium]|nr:hypothetical protein [Elusimicrobiota bacterium]